MSAWSISTLGTTSVKVSESVSGKTIIVPLGEVMLRKDENDSTGKFFFVDGVNNNVLERISTDDMVTPPFAGTLDTYLSTLAVIFGSSGGGGGSFTGGTLTSAIVTASSSVTASSVDWSLGNSFYNTLSANTSFTFSNDADGQTIVFAVTQAAAGGPYTATFPAAVVWFGGTEPTMTSTASRTDIYTFVRINSVVYGSSIQNFS